MEKCLKNRIAIAVFEEICAEDFHGTAPGPNTSEENEHHQEKRPRRAGDDISYEKVVLMTDMARELGASRAERTWKKVHLEDVSRQTFDKYLRHWVEKAKDKSVAPNDRYFKPTERGRSFALDSHEVDCVLEAIKLFRKKKKSVCARAVSRIARGTVRRLRPGLIEAGVLCLGLSWAKLFMHRRAPGSGRGITLTMRSPWLLLRRRWDSRPLFCRLRTANCTASSCYGRARPQSATRKASTP